jgi:hypothetical protein
MSLEARGNDTPPHGSSMNSGRRHVICKATVATAVLNAYHKTYLRFRATVDFVGFAFWPHQKTGFEASERNKDASRPQPTKMLYAHIPSVWLLSWRAQQQTERGGGGREKRTRRKRRDRRNGDEAQANSLPGWSE